MLFSQKLIFLRKKHNLTQRDLAKLLNLSQTAVAKYERNASEPDISTLIRLSDIFDVSIDYLLNKTNITDDYIKISDITPFRISKNELMELIKAYAYLDQSNREHFMALMIQISTSRINEQ